MNYIYPGKILLDNNNKKVEAHGGSIFYEDGIYYFYGENKEFTNGKTKVRTYGVKYYSSIDLYHRKDEGFLIEPDLENKNSNLHPSHYLDRPHIVKNNKTNKYICYIKYSHPKKESYFMVLVSDSFKGPYKVVKNNYRPYGLLVGDFDIYIDKNNDAYLYFTNMKDGIIAYKLDREYLNAEGNYKRYYVGINFPFSREGVALFEYEEELYIITSGMTGYVPNQSRIDKLSSPLGELLELGDISINDLTNTTFHSQISSVFKDPKTGVYIALADRWIPSYKLTPKKSERIIRALASTNDKRYRANIFELFSLAFVPLNCKKVNTSLAQYVWLPINFQFGYPKINWIEKWNIEEVSKSE